MTNDADCPVMTPAEFRDSLKTLSLTHERAATVLGVELASIRAYTRPPANASSRKVPPALARTIRAMIALEIEFLPELDSRREAAERIAIYPRILATGRALQGREPANVFERMALSLVELAGEIDYQAIPDLNISRRFMTVVTTTSLARVLARLRLKRHTVFEFPVIGRQVMCWLQPVGDSGITLNLTIAEVAAEKPKAWLCGDYYNFSYAPLTAGSSGVTGNEAETLMDRCLIEVNSKDDPKLKASLDLYRQFIWPTIVLQAMRQVGLTQLSATKTEAE